MVNNNKVSVDFAKNEMRQNGDNIRRWAQSDNPILKMFASEVLDAGSE